MEDKQQEKERTSDIECIQKKFSDHFAFSTVYVLTQKWLFCLLQSVIPVLIHGLALDPIRRSLRESKEECKKIPKSQVPCSEHHPVMKQTDR